jgi:thiol-disulfide isomerase/thioredoxin
MWATYCAPCRKSLPHLQAIAAQHQDVLQVLALSADDSQAKIEDFVNSRNIDLPIAFGEEVNALMSQLQVQSLPTEFFIDAQGNIRFSFVGAATSEQLDQAVAELLQTP